MPPHISLLDPDAAAQHRHRDQAVPVLRSSIRIEERDVGRHRQEISPAEGCPRIGSRCPSYLGRYLFWPADQPAAGSARLETIGSAAT